MSVLKDAIEKKWLACVVLAFLVAASYANSLFNPFMWDDIVLVPENPLIKEGIKGILTAFNPAGWGGRVDTWAFQGFYRPFHTIHSLLDYSVWGLNPFGYHLSNTVLHFINTVLLYTLARRITGDAVAAFIGASIFAVHPVHTESVTFISARPDLEAMFFLMLSFHIYLSLKGLEGARLYAAKAASLVLFLFALLSKEMALTLPLLLTAYAFIFEEKGGRIKRVAPYYVLLAGYFVFRVFALSAFTSQHKIWAGPVTLAFTAAAAVLDYTRLLVFPWPLKAYYSIVWYKLGVKVLLAFSLMLGAGGLALWLLIKKKKAAAFFLIWTFMAMLPVLNIGGLGEFAIAERYLYIPSIGYSVFLAGVIAYLLKMRGAAAKTALYATVALVIAFSFLTAKRNTVWADDLTFYAEMVKGAPGSPLPHRNLYKAYYRRGQLEPAADSLARAVMLAPGNHELRFELGSLYMKMKRFSAAAESLERAVELKEDYSEAYNSLGIAYAELGAFDAADYAFRKALEARPDSVEARKNLERLELIRQ